MMKRIFAWVLLAGFVLLILNLIVFRFYWQLSMVVYLIIVFAFMLTNGKLIKTQEQDKYSSDGSDEHEGIDELDDNDGNTKDYDDDIITDNDILNVSTDNDYDNNNNSSADDINAEDK